MNFIKLSTLLSILFFITACSTTSSPMKDHEEAGGTNVSQSNPTAANYNVQLGVNYLQQGDVQRAKHKLLTAMDQAPDSSQTQAAMGYFMENTGEQLAAEKYYQKAVDLNPQAGSAHYNYGSYLCRQKRYQEADKQFQLAVQDVNYLNTAVAYENAGVCAMQIPDFNKAAGYFQKAVSQDPRRANAFLQLGKINYSQSSFAAAQQNLNQYMQLVTDPSAEALWLGVRLARSQNDNTTAGRYAIMLQTKYPNSDEYKQLRMTQAPKQKPDATFKMSNFNF